MEQRINLKSFLPFFPEEAGVFLRFAELPLFQGRQIACKGTDDRELYRGRLPKDRLGRGLRDSFGFGKDYAERK